MLGLCFMNKYDNNVSFGDFLSVLFCELLPNYKAQLNNTIPMQYNTHSHNSSSNTIPIPTKMTNIYI